MWKIHSTTSFHLMSTEHINEGHVIHSKCGNTKITIGTDETIN